MSTTPVNAFAAAQEAQEERLRRLRALIVALRAGAERCVVADADSDALQALAEIALDELDRVVDLNEEMAAHAAVEATA